MNLGFIKYILILLIQVLIKLFMYIYIGNKIKHYFTELDKAMACV